MRVLFEAIPTMAESLLRDLQCRRAKPRATSYRLSDGGSLALLIKPTGLKYWQFRYRKPDGREGLIQIGPYPRVTLEAARSARNRKHLATTVHFFLDVTVRCTTCYLL